MAALDRLDDVPWSRLACVAGNARHVPKAVRGLLSVDLSQVEAAYWRLENHVVVQGQLFESAAYLPEFLIEVLETATFPSAAQELLFQIGNGCSLDADLECSCHATVVSALEQWMATSERAIRDPELRDRVEDDLRDLREDHPGL